MYSPPPLGIGWTTTLIVFFLNCYYNVILAWAFYYMFASFTSELPWESCDNYWNTPACTTFDELKVSYQGYSSVVNILRIRVYFEKRNGIISKTQI